LDLDSGDIISAPARKAPEIPERNGRTPGMSSALAVTAVVPDCGATLGAAAFAVSCGVTGVAAPEVPGGGLFGAEPGLPGVAPGAVELFGGALPAGAGGGVLLDEPDDGAPPDGAPDDDPPDAPEDAAPLADDAPPCALGSALRMIGRPSLPEPITTTLALGDCDSKSVASMPRQRK
jgi:hypothetical protein